MKRRIFVTAFVLLGLAGIFLWAYAVEIEACFFGIIGDSCEIYHEMPN